MAATGLLATERHRRLNGVGQHVKQELEDVALAVMGRLGFIADPQLGHPPMQPAETSSASGFGYPAGILGPDDAHMNAD